VIAQSQTEFKTSQGFEFDLPKNTEWLVNTRADGFANNHYWEWSASRQKWSASSDFGGVFENGVTNNKIGFSYNGYF
jgi:antibiotic biosynthesis monooxygenase (ABM) superfamily enzyme